MVKWVVRKFGIPDKGAISSDRVLVCRICGNINDADLSHCSNCRLSLAGITTVHEPEGRRLSRRIRLPDIRSRFIRIGLLLAIVVGLTVWGVLVFFEIGPSPSEATTTLSAAPGIQSWAQSGRTPANTGFTPDQAPLSRLETKWTYATSEPITTSPAVSGERVYLTTEDGRALALDRKTGQQIWEYRTDAPVYSSPAVAGDLVFFGLPSKRFVALDRETGVLRWEINLGNPVLADPIVVDGTVYVGSTDSRLYALDAATGEKLWSFKTEDWIYARVAFVDNLVAINSRDGLLHIVDTNTGRKRFVYDSGWSMNGGPVIHEDKVYFMSDRGTIWAVDQNTITYPFERAWWTVRFNLYIWGVLSNAPGQKGTVWGTAVDGDAYSSLAIGHGMVYAATDDGGVFAIDADTGKRLWNTDIGISITSDPVVAGQTLLVGTLDGTIYGLDAFTGQQQMTFKTGGEISASPVVVGDTMYVTSRDGTLYAVTSGQTSP